MDRIGSAPVTITGGPTGVLPRECRGVPAGAMPGRRQCLRASRIGGWLFAGALGLASATPAGAISILKAFPGDPSGGAAPHASLVLDGAGNLYGTTEYGGASDCGTVFRIKSDGSGFTVLHNFTLGASDGAAPEACLILDGAGNLYGTTASGGALGYGTVFKLKTDGTGFAVLHSFTGFADYSDGANPYASLALDDAGFLYGTTTSGGAWGFGTAFRVRTDGTRFWVLYCFLGGVPNGLILDGAGSLYGTTDGTIFKLKTDGTSFAVLHSFAGGASDGAAAEASLILDGADNLYGTTSLGGASGQGTVLRVKTDGTGFAVLHSFAGGASDGANPWASLALDSAGNLCGTTYQGGVSSKGTVFRVKSDGTGFAVLYSFAGGASDGAYPYASVILDGAGNLYGTTYQGGAWDQGTVFALPVTGGKAPAFTSVSSATFLTGVPGIFTVTTTGYPVPTLTSSGACPAGVTFTDNGDGTATLAGTAPASSAGTYPLTLTAHNGIGADASQSFTLTVSTLAIATSSALPNGTEGSPYNVTLSATGGTPPYTWSVTSGSLPAGLLLNGSSGAISGKPTASGDFSFAVRVTDSASATVQGNFTLHVNPSYSVWVPVASHNGGKNNSQWRSDLGLLNTSTVRANVQIEFYGGDGVVSKTTYVPAGTQSILADVVGQLNGSNSGALEILSDQPLKVTARSYNQVAPDANCYAGGTQGQDYPVLAASDGLVAGQSAYLAGLVENKLSYRSNIGLVNVGSGAATVLVELFDGAGNKLADYTVSLNPGDWKQETQPFWSKAAQTAMDRGYAKITVQSGSGIFGFASVIDNTTNDPTTVTMQQ